MSEHTPAPWAARRTHHFSTDTWYVIVDSQGRGPIIEVGGKDEDGQIAEAKYLVTNPTIIAANAQLIAAAPELLEAAKGARDVLGSTFAYVDPQFRNKCEALVDAIAKAEGDES